MVFLTAILAVTAIASTLIVIQGNEIVKDSNKIAENSNKLVEQGNRSSQAAADIAEATLKMKQDAADAAKARAKEKEDRALELQKRIQQLEGQAFDEHTASSVHIGALAAQRAMLRHLQELQGLLRRRDPPTDLGLEAEPRHPELWTPEVIRRWIAHAAYHLGSSLVLLQQPSEALVVLKAARDACAVAIGDDDLRDHELVRIDRRIADATSMGGTWQVMALKAYLDVDRCAKKLAAPGAPLGEARLRILNNKAVSRFAQGRADQDVLKAFHALIANVDIAIRDCDCDTVGMATNAGTWVVPESVAKKLKGPADLLKTRVKEVPDNSAAAAVAWPPLDVLHRPELCDAIAGEDELTKDIIDHLTKLQQDRLRIVKQKRLTARTNATVVACSMGLGHVLGSTAAAAATTPMATSPVDECLKAWGLDATVNDIDVSKLAQYPWQSDDDLALLDKPAREAFEKACEKACEDTTSISGLAQSLKNATQPPTEAFARLRVAVAEACLLAACTLTLGTNVRRKLHNAATDQLKPLEKLAMRGHLYSDTLVSLELAQAKADLVARRLGDDVQGLEASVADTQRRVAQLGAAVYHDESGKRHPWPVSLPLTARGERLVRERAQCVLAAVATLASNPHPRTVAQLRKALPKADQLLVGRPRRLANNGSSAKGWARAQALLQLSKAALRETGPCLDELAEAEAEAKASASASASQVMHDV